MVAGSDTLGLIARLARDYFQKFKRLDLPQRLAMFPMAGAPVARPVSIWWDEHQVPFIETETDEDLAVALGMVHAHLRLAQMEVMRRIAQGRLAELVGRRALTIDRFVKTFDIGRAVPQILAAMPPSTLTWLHGFARGINHVLDCTKLPRELTLLGIERQHWTPADIVLLGRLISADVNWLVWARIFRLRKRSDWPQLWRDFCSADILSLRSDNSGNISDLLAGSAIRTGSNSFAVAGFRSDSGSALIASDPHLSITLPNSWLLAGVKSPSHHAVGMMVPGIPFFGIGRNPWIAWGGTSLHAASSDLVSVPEGTTLHVREERIKVLGGRDVIVRIKESPWGPVISDLPAFSGPDTVALRWMGHEPSDEFTAMLRAGTAQNWQEFREAMASYSVPGLEFVFAASSGDIGWLTAVKLPNRTKQIPPDILSSPDDGWGRPVTTESLPSDFNPVQGFVASANARIPELLPVIGYHFSPPVRMERLATLLGTSPTFSAKNLMQFQADVHCTEAMAERDMFCDWLEKIQEQHGIRALLQNWNGNYDADSRAALALETMLVSLAEDLVPHHMREAWEASWGGRSLIRRAIATAPTEKRNQALARAVSAAARNIQSADWGTRHRLVLQHPLGMVPVIGARYRMFDLPAPGSSETLMKTAHGLTSNRHRASYGSISRHVSDLANPDANYFALLGGQDGWIGSSTFADQVELWRRNEYIQLPLRLETVRSTFQHRMVLGPSV
jgi:penicillin G amidase